MTSDKPCAMSCPKWMQLLLLEVSRQPSGCSENKSPCLVNWLWGFGAIDSCPTWWTWWLRADASSPQCCQTSTTTSWDGQETSQGHAPKIPGNQLAPGSWSTICSSGEMPTPPTWWRSDGTVLHTLSPEKTIKDGQPDVYWLAWKTQLLRCSPHHVRADFTTANNQCCRCQAGHQGSSILEVPWRDSLLGPGSGQQAEHLGLGGWRDGHRIRPWGHGTTTTAIDSHDLLPKLRSSNRWVCGRARPLPGSCCPCSRTTCWWAKCRSEPSEGGWEHQFWYRTEQHNLLKERCDEMFEANQDLRSYLQWQVSPSANHNWVGSQLACPAGQPEDLPGYSWRCVPPGRGML